MKIPFNLSFCWMPLLFHGAVVCFVPRWTPQLQPILLRDKWSRTKVTHLGFFRRNKPTEATDEDKDEIPANGESSESSPDSTATKSMIPWFVRSDEMKPTTTSTIAANAVVAKQTIGAENVESTKPSPSLVMATSSAEPVSPEVLAARYRAEAEKARLEAERMDAELTLRKIERLEREIASAQSDPSGSSKKDTVENLQREMDALLNKMKGGTTAPQSIRRETPLTKVSIGARTREKTIQGTSYRSNDDTSAPKSRLASLTEPYSESRFQETLKYVQESPNFLKKTMAIQVEMDYTNVTDINVTELAVRFDMMTRLDFSYSSRPHPRFTVAQINDRAKELSENTWARSALPPKIQQAGLNNETELAILSLEYEYYLEDSQEMTMDQLEKIVEDEEWLKPVMAAMNKSAVDGTIETLYPKSMRRDPDKPQYSLPTIAQVKQFTTDILPKALFTPSGEPEKVAGGYIIRGVSRQQDGTALIERIDQQMAKSSLGTKMNVLYTNDFTIFAREDMVDDPGNQPPIIFVTAPDICRESRPVALSIVSALGLATSWYLSIFPFLLNPTVEKRVEEQLALAEANMTPDLVFLTDLSFPLFATFLGIQLLHEVAHVAVASANNFTTSVPCFVPSLITGITSSVTAFKTLPKNKNAMFDYGVAGPLVGMVASLAAIVIGSELTTTVDPSNLPALPLEILRQSTLGGGIIENILGNGALSVPKGAIGTQAVAGITIPLHPVAVAGYIGLIVNALSVLPIGTTDGGRIGLALMGRGAKLLVGNITLITLLACGLIGSDLFLFYFAFCVAFQSGNDVPSRNEADKVDFSRVIVAMIAYGLALLSLIPFQN